MSKPEIIFRGPHNTPYLKGVNCSACRGTGKCPTCKGDGTLKGRSGVVSICNACYPRPGGKVCRTCMGEGLEVATFNRFN